jgi:hypothetical protein
MESSERVSEWRFILSDILESTATRVAGNWLWPDGLIRTIKSVGVRETLDNPHGWFQNTGQFRC